MKRVLCHIIQNMILCITGGLLYTLIEYFFRGYSHISMFLLGGIDFVIIGAVNEHRSVKMGIVSQSVLGSAIITISELITGYIVNIKLGLNVWDYSDLPFNFWGQICLYYSLVWIPVSTMAIILDDILRAWLFGEKMPQYFVKK